MNSTRKVVAGLAVVVVLTASGPAFAEFPDQWTRGPANPVSTDLAGMVLFHDGVYKMWGGLDGFDYATSVDGRVWAEHPASPVLVAGPEWYDELEVANAAVVIVDGFYHMWYSGIAADGNNRIAHATSPDGIAWTKDSASPVMDLGPPGSLDEQELIHPFVIYEDPLFRMWYNGVGGAVSEQRILYAESLDGVLWARDSTAALEAGSPGEWDDDFLVMMCVLPFGNSYYMFYTAGNTAGEFAIGYATSPDGNSWVKRIPSEPVLGPGAAGTWDDLAVLRPVVLATGTEFKMWYLGTRDFENFSWGLATASDPTGVPKAVREDPSIRLGQNAPNPFNPRTTIQYSLAAPAQVVLQIHDAAGRHVCQLIDGRTIGAGSHQVRWNGRDEMGRDVAAGVYFYRLEAGDYSETKRMVLVK